MNKALLVDVGGTNMRYAIASKDSDDISNINKLPFNSNDFEIHLEQLIKENDTEILVLSAAGPKINNSISMTNRNFTFDANDIKNKFSLKECFLLNDLKMRVLMLLKREQYGTKKLLHSSLIGQL